MLLRNFQSTKYVRFPNNYSESNIRYRYTWDRRTPLASGTREGFRGKVSVKLYLEREIKL